jgi:hypothetical protein
MYVQGNDSNIKYKKGGRGGCCTTICPQWLIQWFNIISPLCQWLDPIGECPIWGGATYPRASSMPAKLLLRISLGELGVCRTCVGHLPSLHTHTTLSLQQGPGSRQFHRSVVRHTPPVRNQDRCLFGGFSRFLWGGGGGGAVHFSPACAPL